MAFSLPSAPSLENDVQLQPLVGNEPEEGAAPLLLQQTARINGTALPAINQSNERRESSSSSYFFCFIPWDLSGVGEVFGNLIKGIGEIALPILEILFAFFQALA